MKVIPMRLFIAIALTVALVDMPIEYYQFLRWIVSLGSLYLIYVFVKQFGWKGPTPIIHLFAIILFNPIFPFYMSRSNWKTVDLVYYFLLFFTAYQYSQLESERDKEEKKVLTNY